MKDTPDNQKTHIPTRFASISEEVSAQKKPQQRRLLLGRPVQWTDSPVTDTVNVQIPARHGFLMSRIETAKRIPRRQRTACSQYVGRPTVPNIGCPQSSDIVLRQSYRKPPLATALPLAGLNPHTMLRLVGTIVGCPRLKTKPPT